jgi:transposase
VTEHQGEVKRCPGCGSLARGAFPSEATQATQYGPGVRAVAAYLSGYQLLPLARIVELFGDLFGHRPSESMVLNASKRVFSQIRPSLDAIGAQLTASAVIHCDETGLRVDGKLCWLHTVGTPQLTWYAPHPKRGAEAMRAVAILPSFRGCAVHDGWKSYFTFDECAHALCNAHHLRELQFVKEQYGQTWAEGMSRLLREMHTVVKTAPPGWTRLPREQRSMYERLYDVWLFRGKVENPEPNESRPAKRGPRKQTPPKNLLDRLERYKHETLAFLRDFRVPFDNSLAERDIRMVKVKQKVSGCFRTWQGAELFCAIRSYISTARKQEVPVLDSIRNAILGKPFMPAHA